MDEELLKSLHDRAVLFGFPDGEQELLEYIGASSDAFNEMYSYAYSQGLALNENTFANSLGIQKPIEESETPIEDTVIDEEPVKKKEQEPTESLSEDGVSDLSEYIKAPSPEGRYTIDGVELSKEDFERQIKETPKEVLQGSAITIENDKDAERLLQRKQYFETDEDLKLPPGMEWMEKYIPEPDRIFNNSLKAVDEDLMNTSEEFVVPELNYLFNQYGFDFEETDYLGDGVLVKAPNDKSERFNLDPAFYGAKEEAARLRAFLKENKPEEDERLKIVSDNLKIKKQKIINDEQMNKFAKDFNSNVEEYMKEVAIYNQMVEDRINMNREAFEQKYNITEEGFRKTTKRLKSLSQSFQAKGREFDRMVGEYNMMKEQRGSTALLGGFFLSALDMPREGLGRVLSSAYSQYAQLKSMIPAVKYNIGIGREEMKEKYPDKTIEEISDIIKDESDKELKKELYGKDTYYVNPFSGQATALSREFSEGMKDYLRDFIVDVTGGKVAEEKRTEKIKRESFVGGALLGLAESLPSFVIPYGIGPALLMADFVSEEMEKNPKFDDIPEDEKLAVANIIGTAGGFLEYYGLRNVIAQKGFFNNLIAGAINKFSTQGATAAGKKSFAEFVKDDIQNKFIKGGALVVAGGLAEFETGAAQETVDIIVNNVYNDYVRNKEMFETPDIMSFEAVHAILYAGAQEAVGGKFMGAVNATVGLATGSLESGTDFEFKIFQELSQDPMTYDQYSQYLDIKVANNEITKKERDKKLNNYNQMNEAMQQFKDITGLDGMPQDVSVETQKDIVRLLVRRNKRKLEAQNSKLSIVKNNKLAEANKIEKKIEQLLTVEAEVNAANQNEVIDPSKIGTDELMVYPEDTYDMTFQDQESVPESVSSLEAQETQEAEDGSVTLTFSGQQLIDGGLATESKIEESDETGSVSELFEVDEGVSVAFEVGQLEETAEGYKASAVKEMVDNAKKAFKKVLPNVKFILHRNDESFNKETTEDNQKNASGLTKIVNGQVYVHINQQRATGTTVGHEMVHALQLSEGRSAEIRAAIEGQIDDETKAELEGVLDESGTKDDNEEYNSEYFGILTDNYRNGTPTVKERIADFLQNLLDTLNIPIKINKTNDNEILNLLNTLARKVARGKKITKKEAAKIGYTLNTDGTTVRSQKVGARKIKPAEVKTKRVKVKSKKQIEKDANNLALVRSLRDKLKKTKLESEKKAIRKRINDLKKRYRYRVEMAMITSIIADGRLTQNPETAISDFLVNKLGYSASLVDRVMSIDKKYLDVMPDVFARTKKSIDLFKKVNAYRNRLVSSNSKRKGKTSDQIDALVEARGKQFDYDNRHRTANRLRKRKNESDQEFADRKTEYVDKIAAERKKVLKEYRDEQVKMNSKLLLPRSTDEIAEDVVNFMRSQKEYPANQSDAVVMDREIRKLIRTTAKVGKFIKIRQSTLMKKVSGMEILKAREAIKEFVIQMLPSNININNKVVKDLLNKIDKANTETIVPLVESDIMETITKLQVDKLKKDIANLMKVEEVRLRDGRIVGFIDLPWQGNIRKVKDQVEEINKMKEEDLQEYVEKLSEMIEKRTLEQEESDEQQDIDNSANQILLSYANAMLVEDTNPTKINNLEDFKENFISLYQNGRSALQEKIREQKISTVVDQIYSWISLTYGSRPQGNIFDGMTKDDVRAAVENQEGIKEAKKTSMSKINGLVAALPSTFYKGKKKQKEKYSELTQREKERFQELYPEYNEFFALTELVQSQYTQESDYAKSDGDFNLEEKTYKDLADGSEGTNNNKARFEDNNSYYVDLIKQMSKDNNSLVAGKQNPVITMFRVVKRAIDEYLYKNMAFYNIMDKLCKAPSIVMGQQFQQEFTNELDEASLMSKEGELYLNGAIMDAMERIIGKDWKSKTKKYQSLNKRYAITFSGNYSMDEVNRDVRKMFPTAKNYNDLAFLDQQQFLKKHGKYKIQTVTLGEAAYWYNQYKNDETHRGFLEGNEISGNQMQGIFLELKEKAPELIAFADWQVNEFFPSVYSRYNKVYKEIFHTNMEYNQNYAGRLYRENEANSQDYDIFDRMKNFDYVYGGPASIKARRKNKNAIRKIDINSALFSYVRDMEYFRAYAKPLRKLNSVFGAMGPGKAKKQVTEALDQMYGKNFRTFINQYISRINRNGASERGGFAYLAQKAFVYGKIGGLAIPIFLKQLTSSITYANDIGYINWGVNLLASTPELGLELAKKITSGKYNPASFVNNFIPDYQSSVKEIFENSSYIKSRYDSNNALLRNISSFNTNELVEMFPGNKFQQFGADFGNFMLALTREGDKAAIMLGGIPNYRFYKNEFKKNNEAKDDETQQEYEQRAIDYAIKKFEKDTKTTQQSSDVQDRDFYQTEQNVFVRGFSLFMTAQKQYLRKETRGAKQIVRGIKNFRPKEVFEGMRTVFTYHVLAPALFQFVSLGLPGIARDWDDEDTDKLFWAAILGNLNSFFVAGDILNTIRDTALGYFWAGNVKVNPALQMVSDFGRNYKEFYNAKTDEKKEKYMNKMALLAGEFLGLPTTRTVRFIDNYMKLYDDWETMPLGEKILRFTNFSEYAINGGKIEKNSRAKSSKASRYYNNSDFNTQQTIDNSQSESSPFTYQKIN